MITPPSEVEIALPRSRRTSDTPRFRACSTKCQSGGRHTGSFSLLSTVSRPRGVSKRHVLAPPSLTSVLPLPVATWVVNSVASPFFSQMRFSSRLTTRYGRSLGGSALAASWSSACPRSTCACTASSRSRFCSATIRMTLRRKRRPTMVSTNSHVEAAVSASIPRDEIPGHAAAVAEEPYGARRQGHPGLHQ